MYVYIFKTKKKLLTVSTAEPAVVWYEKLSTVK